MGEVHQGNSKPWHRWGEREGPGAKATSGGGAGQETQPWRGKQRKVQGRDPALDSQASPASPGLGEAIRGSGFECQLG